jgi:hypothetical protein
MGIEKEFNKCNQMHGGNNKWKKRKGKKIIRN